MNDKPTKTCAELGNIIEDAAMDSNWKVVDAALTDLMAKDEEIKRLRGALREILALDMSFDDPFVEKAWQIAADALDHKEDEGKSA